MNNKPYLDKVVTAPHVPRQPGQIGFHTTKNFPDLSHTGLRSKFEPQVPSATTADGRITDQYKRQAFLRNSAVERQLVKLNSREDVFKTGHKQFIDKVLCDMEDTKRRKSDRHMKHWNSSKSQLGFADSFNNTSGNVISSTTTFHPHLTGTVSRGSPTTSADDAYYDDSEFAPETPAGGDNPTGQQSESTLQDTHDRGLKAVSFHESHATIAGTAGNMTRGNTGNTVSSHHSTTTAGAGSTVLRSPKPYSTMTLFNSLLNDTPPASPKKRFGTLSSATSFRSDT